MLASAGLKETEMLVAFFDPIFSDGFTCRQGGAATCEPLLQLHDYGVCVGGGGKIR